MTQHTESPRSENDPKVTLRSPADLADALPYLMGFHPTDSIVMVALHGDHGRFGGRLRLGIPKDRGEWPAVASQLADCLVRGSEQRGDRAASIVLFLCQDPSGTERPSEVMERLRPLAQRLRTACGALDVPVIEALCVSAGRWWSYCCAGSECCPADGFTIATSGDSVMAAAAAYAGINVRSSLREMEARLVPPAPERTAGQALALDRVCAELVPRILDVDDCEAVRHRTLTLVGAALERFRATPADGDPARSDRRDDALLGNDEAAEIILGLQDRAARDRAGGVDGAAAHRSRAAPVAGPGPAVRRSVRGPRRRPADTGRLGRLGVRGRTRGARRARPRARPRPRLHLRAAAPPLGERGARPRAAAPVPAPGAAPTGDRRV
ncbi:hypothetical protein M2266_005327 [Streptomyces sp. SPB162]|nr:hypothetical protein [Streptomyces sp. SPB162]